MLQWIQQAYATYWASWRRMPLGVRALVGGSGGGVAAGVLHLVLPAHPHHLAFGTLLLAALVSLAVVLPIQYVGYRLWLDYDENRPPPGRRRY